MNFSYFSKFFIFFIIAITSLVNIKITYSRVRERRYRSSLKKNCKVLNIQNNIIEKQVKSESPQKLRNKDSNIVEKIIKDKNIKKDVNCNNILIRVLLDQRKASNIQLWEFNSSKGFIIASQENNKSYHIKDATLTIKLDNNIFLVNGRKYPYTQMIVIPYKDDHIIFNNNSYHGQFVLSLVDNQLYLVNYIDLEDYVLSVLPSETWPGWPEEVNKAFCICFRTYALSKILEQRACNKKRNKNILYDIKNTNIHQTYKGFKVSPIFKKVADQTRDIILAYNNKPIVAMFDSCCGGIVPAHLSDVNFLNAPYLERQYPCNYCKKCFLYSWKKEFFLKDLEKKLVQDNKKLIIRDIKVTKLDKAGKIQEVKVKTPQQWLSISGKKLYSLLPEVKSFCYKIIKKGHKVIFQGKGYGHHIGLCQWGAYHMVKEGWDYKSILKFYYPGTTFMKLQAKL